MTEFKYKDRLAALVKDYENNSEEIVDMIWNYFKENEDELSAAITEDYLKYLPDIQDIYLVGDKCDDTNYGNTRERCSKW